MAQKSDNVSAICVIGNDYSGYSAFIRVDRNKAVETGDNGCMDAQPILSQLTKGSRVRTKYHEWPKGYSQDAEGSLKGLNSALEKMRKLYRKAKGV